MHLIQGVKMQVTKHVQPWGSWEHLKKLPALSIPRLHASSSSTSQEQHPAKPWVKSIPWRRPFLRIKKEQQQQKTNTKKYPKPIPYSSHLFTGELAARSLSTDKSL